MFPLELLSLERKLVSSLPKLISFERVPRLLMSHSEGNPAVRIEECVNDH